MNINQGEETILAEDEHMLIERRRLEIEKQVSTRTDLYQEILDEFGPALAAHNLKVIITPQPQMPATPALTPGKSYIIGQPLVIKPPFDRAWISTGSDDTAAIECEQMFPDYGIDPVSGKSELRVQGDYIGDQMGRWTHGYFEKDLQLVAGQLYAITFEFEVQGSYCWNLDPGDLRANAQFSAEVEYELTDQGGVPVLPPSTPWHLYRRYDLKSPLPTQGRDHFYHRSAPQTFLFKAPLPAAPSPVTPTLVPAAATYVFSLRLGLGYGGWYSKGRLEGGLTVL